MGNLRVHEGEKGFLEVTLTYGSNWSVAADRGKPIPKTATSQVYFHVKNEFTDSTPIITLTDADTSQIEWTDATNGKITVKLGTTTVGYAGNDKVYELRLKMSDGSWLTAKSGKLDILPSVVGTPA